VACLAAKPVVDGLERDWTGGRVIRVDIRGAEGSAFAATHGLSLTPSFILFDAAGRESGRWTGRPPSLAEITAALNNR
jgi:hypothetical protein